MHIVAKETVMIRGKMAYRKMIQADKTLKSILTNHRINDILRKGLSNGTLSIYPFENSATSSVKMKMRLTTGTMIVKAPARCIFLDLIALSTFLLFHSNHLATTG